MPRGRSHINIHEDLDNLRKEVIPDEKYLLGASKIPDAINIGNVISHRNKYNGNLFDPIYIY